MITKLACAYCKELKTFHRKKKLSEFSSEHVISQSFGTYGVLTMTLNKEVCKVCNQYFGDELELKLGRDSAFGVVHRGRSGLVDVKNLIHDKKHLQKLSESYVDHPQLGTLLVDLIDFEKKDKDFFTVGIAEQFRILNSTKGKRVVCRAKNLPHRRVLENMGLCMKNGYFEILYNPLTSQNSVQILNLALRKSNIEFILTEKASHRIGLREGESENAQQDLRFYSIVDRTIARAIAKIAFNYFIFHYGINIALSGEFDAIRDFIRYGIDPDYIIFTASHERLYYRPTLGKGGSVGHVVSIHHSSSDGSIKARVSFFNLEFFEILLAKEYQGHMQSKGSFFDFQNKKIFTHVLSGLANDYVVSNFIFKIS